MNKINETLIQSRQSSLKTKRICRFCLTQLEPLSLIYSRENRLKSSAPLPLQVMACVSIEVFTNDGMPSTICDSCRMLMEHCYRFKQMCKKADTALRQFPLTGTLPKPLDIPKLSEDPANLNNNKSPKILNPGAKFAISPSTKQLVVTEKPKSTIAVVNSPRIILNALPKQLTIAKTKPKLLNNSSTTIKILNKDIIKPVLRSPVLSPPRIKEKEDGEIEIVTEILESLDNSLDPLLVEEERKPLQHPQVVEEIEINVFPCPHCERSFPLRQLLDIHMVNHNRDRDFECNVCSRRFFSKYDLGKHNLIHTGEKPYQCVVCKKAFTRSTLLHRHEKIHTDIPKYSCVYCDKPFLSVNELEKHTERHQKNRPFACKLCGKSFAFKQGLERHEVIHAKEQPYPCQYCDESFPTPSKLSRHLTGHAGSRPFPCKLCPKSYLLSHHLTRHLRSHKEGSGSYKCFDCEQNFTTRDDLIYHSAVHATQTLVCPLCKEHFEDLDMVTEHIRLHAEGEQYACEFCDLIFMTAKKLSLHSDIEHMADLAVYEEHTRNNIKREKVNDKNDTTAHQESGEVLQEFIVEEYHQSADSENENENEEDLEREKITTVNSNREKRMDKGKKRSRNKATEDLIQQMIDIDEMELQNTFDDINQSGDEMPAEEPAPKKLKTFQSTPKTTEKPAARTNNKKDSQQQAAAAIVIKSEKNEPKMKQPSIKSSLKSIPKPTMSVKEAAAQSSTKRILNDKIVVKDGQKPSSVVEMKKVNPVRKSAPVSHNTRDKSSPRERTTTRSKPNVVEEEEEDLEEVEEEEDPLKITDFEPVKLNKNLPEANKSSSSKRTSTQSRTSDGGAGGDRMTSSKKVVEMLIGDRKVKVQKITMSKAEAQKMAKEGRIKMENGAMILKQSSKNSKNLRKTRNLD